MSKLAGLALALGLTVAASANAASITGFGDPLTDPLLQGGAQEGFDAVSDGEYASITIGDVTYSGVDGPLTIGTDYNGSFNTTGGKSAYNNFDYVPRQFRFDFHSAVNSFAFNFGASDSNWMLQAFDTSGALLDSLIINPVLGSNSGDYFGLSSGSFIGYALLTSVIDGDEYDDDFVFVDRFTINNGGSDVPLPAALPLFASGLAGVFALRRKKSSPV